MSIESDCHRVRLVAAEDVLRTVQFRWRRRKRGM